MMASSSCVASGGSKSPFKLEKFEDVTMVLNQPISLSWPRSTVDHQRRKKVIYGS